MLWVILAIIFLLLAVLLCSPVTVKVSYFKTLNIGVNFLFLKWKFPSVSKKSKEQKEVPSEKTDKKSIISSLSASSELIKQSLSKINRLLHHITVNKFFLKVMLAGGDPAELAVQYGMLCVAVYPTLGFMNSLMNFHKQTIKLSCDYDSDNSVLEFKTVITLRLVFAIIAAISLALSYIKYIIGNNNKKELNFNG